MARPSSTRTVVTEGAAVSSQTAAPALAGTPDAAGVQASMAAPFYRCLLLLACVSMVGTLSSILLGIVARLANWDFPGLDAYAGYSIAAALFLALPSTLQGGEHIRVTLVLHRLGPQGRSTLEWVSLLAGLALSSYVAYYACRLSWVSWTTHDISQGLDATPLWIPQSLMALGCLGFVLAFVDATLSRVRGKPFFADTGDGAHVE
jgi:TRAP-type C4-dicarboxylate transport system permease small subunit